MGVTLCAAPATPAAAYSVHGVPSPHPISSPRVSAPIRGPQSPFSPHGSGLVSGGWAPRQPQALSTPYAPGGGFFRGSMVAGSPEFLEQQTQVAKLAHLLAAPGERSVCHPTSPTATYGSPSAC